MTEHPCLVSFYISNEVAHATVLSAGAPTRCVHLDVSSEELRDVAARFTRAFSSDRINPRRPSLTTDLVFGGSFDSVLRAWGKRLLDDAIASLPPGQQLVISRHRELHDLPLHALELRGEPLLARHPVTYAHSLALYANVRRRRLIEQSGSAVGFAAGFREESERDHLSFRTSVQQLVGDGVLHHGVQMTKRRLADSLGQAALLHLSCHGLFDEQSPLESALFLSDGHTLASSNPSHNTAAHRLTVREVLGWHRSPSVVVLDACLSGRQRLHFGDEPIGFPTALLIAGARAVVASGWPIDATAASYFMSTFGQTWHGDVSISAAYRAASLATREKFPHPYHWGMFFLHGEDTTIRPLQT